MQTVETISENVDMFRFICFSILSSSECSSKDNRKNKCIIFLHLIQMKTPCRINLQAIAILWSFWLNKRETIDIFWSWPIRIYFCNCPYCLHFCPYEQFLTDINLTLQNSCRYISISTVHALKISLFMTVMLPMLHT